MSFADLLTVADVAVRGRLGGNVTYTPTVGVAVTVDGIFDRAYERLDLGNPGVSSYGPGVFLTLTDLPSNPAVDTTATVTVSGVTYLPYEYAPDGLGGIVLHMHEVS